MKITEIYLLIVSAITYALGVGGFLAPALISHNDSLDVVIGVALLVTIPLVVVWLANKIIHMIETLEKGSTKNEV